MNGDRAVADLAAARAYAAGEAALIPAGAVMAPVVLTVYGRPAPQGSKRAYPIWAGSVCRSCGQRRYVRTRVEEQTGKYLHAWRAAVTAAGLGVSRGRVLLDGPLAGSVVVTLARPASGDHTVVPDGPPDLDKLLRAALDALTDARVIADDSRLVWLDYVGKVYPGGGRPDTLDRPGAVIRLRRADD